MPITFPNSGAWPLDLWQQVCNQLLAKQQAQQCHHNVLPLGGEAQKNDGAFANATREPELNSSELFHVVQVVHRDSSWFPSFQRLSPQLLPGDFAPSQEAQCSRTGHISGLSDISWKARCVEGRWSKWHIDISINHSGSGDQNHHSHGRITRSDTSSSLNASGLFVTFVGVVHHLIIATFCNHEI